MAAKKTKKTTAKKTAKKKAAKKTAKKPAAKRGRAAPAKKAAPKKAAAKKKPAAKKTAAKRTAKKKRPAAKKASSAKGGKRAAAKASTTKKSSTKSQAAAEVAARVLAGEDDKSVADLGDDLVSGKKSVAAQAARVLDEIVDRQPEAIIPIIDKFATAIGGPQKRPAQSAAHALPTMAREAPARVARHLPRLKESFDGATHAGKDGLIRTFAGLCTASVAYQKRLEDVLNQGLREADAKTLIAWTEVVLPALKGEPHARARATVEARLGRIPKVHAQKIADFLGIKLRLRYR
ncbi:MAG TPA: hypothetical protein RMH99_15880 [Sandaracinaceae bacterium LLY-WYZ-13_1]|nr:hypothetical protein [Sandaracinaceae bacterium LLY-WYZ-13_1]